METKTQVKTGYSLGTVVAVILAAKSGAGLLGIIFAGFFSWLYVIIYFLTN